MLHIAWTVSCQSSWSGHIRVIHTPGLQVSILCRCDSCDHILFPCIVYLPQSADYSTCHMKQYSADISFYTFNILCLALIAPLMHYSASDESPCLSPHPFAPNDMTIRQWELPCVDKNSSDLFGLFIRL